MPSLHFATLRDGRSPVVRPRAGGGERSGGRTRSRSASRSSISGEHYVVDLLAGLGLTMTVRRLERPLGGYVARGRRPSRCSRRGPGHEHSRPRDRGPPGRRGPSRTTTTRCRACAHAPHLAVAIIFVHPHAGPSCTGACRAWPACRTPGTASEEGDPWWLALAFGFNRAVLRGLRPALPRVYTRAGSRIDWRPAT